MTKELEYNGLEITSFSGKFYISKVEERSKTTVLLKASSYEEDYEFDEDDEEDMVELAKKVIDNEDYRCEICHRSVTFENLETNKVGHNKRFCPDCSKACKKCGETDWEGIGKKKKHSARHGYRYKCQNCGNVVETMPTG